MAERDTRLVYLIRHGETEWSRNGRHTSVTDLALSENGRMAARRLKPVLARETFECIFTSPRRRARETCDLAGYGRNARVEADLVEWNYGDYEGLTTRQIRSTRPGWSLFHDGCPGGESPEQVALRADRLVAKIRHATGNVALFAHGHIFRVIAARWIGLPLEHGARFLLDTATLSVLGYYYETPAIRTWNAPIKAA